MLLSLSSHWLLSRSLMRLPDILELVRSLMTLASSGRDACFTRIKALASLVLLLH